jgi:hypothetical protein
LATGFARYVGKERVRFRHCAPLRLLGSAAALCGGGIGRHHG